MLIQKPKLKEAVRWTSLFLILVNDKSFRTWIRLPQRPCWTNVWLTILKQLETAKTQRFCRLKGKKSLPKVRDESPSDSWCPLPHTQNSLFSLSGHWAWCCGAVKLSLYRIISFRSSWPVPSEDLKFHIKWLSVLKLDLSSAMFLYPIGIMINKNTDRLMYLLSQAWQWQMSKCTVCQVRSGLTPFAGICAPVENIFSSHIFFFNKSYLEKDFYVFN